MDQIRTLMEIGITLKFTETNLFLTKMDFLYTVYFSNLKLNFLLCLHIVKWFFWRSSHILHSYTHTHTICLSLPSLLIISGNAYLVLSASLFKAVRPSLMSL